MKILLAIDGSPCSGRAVAEVARRPWPAGAQLRVISVIEPPAPLVAEPYMGVTGYFEEVERLKQKQAEEILARAKTALGEGEGTAALAVSTDLPQGSPRRVIVEEADAWGADLIVVGSHGYKTWERILLGSVSQAVAAHAHCSVEIVRCREEKAATGDE